jgi:hypothetical protein
MNGTETTTHLGVINSMVVQNGLLFRRGTTRATIVALSKIEKPIPNFPVTVPIPELGLTPGVKFSSGRLGHMWYVSIRYLD